MEAASANLYCSPAPLPEEIWSSWNFDPPLLLSLSILALILARKTPGAAAVAVLMIAFVSPLCALSAALFSARVVHHVLLVVVAAPLIAMAMQRGRATSPMPAFVMSTATLWLWHLPVAYDAAMSNITVYWVMQVTLMLSAITFWRAVIHPAQPLVRVLTYIWAALMQMALLGALLVFAPVSLYAIHFTAPMYWGLSSLEDQQLGGLIMWIPASVPYVIIGALIARRSWIATQGQTA